MCHSLTNPRGHESADIRRQNSLGQPILGVRAPKEGADWGDYQNHFSYVQDHKNVITSKLHSDTAATQDIFTTAQQQDVDKEMRNKPYTGTDVVPSTETPGDSPKRIETKVYSPNPAVCYIRMAGNAWRYGGKINPPNLIGVGQGIGIDKQTGKGVVADASKGGALAHQYGEDRVERWSERTGLKDEAGKQVIRHHCSWVRTYVLDRKPSSGEVFTTGIPQRFQKELLE